MSGKLEFKWNGEELVIKQCDKMKTSPNECETCNNRFVCFTVRVKPDDTEVSSKKTARLSDIMKAVEKIGTD